MYISAFFRHFFGAARRQKAPRKIKKKFLGAEESNIKITVIKKTLYI